MYLHYLTLFWIHGTFPCLEMMIIPKLVYYNFWHFAKITASKTRPVITIFFWSCCLEHKSRSSWQQPTVGWQGSVRTGQACRDAPSNDFSSLQLFAVHQLFEIFNSPRRIFLVWICPDILFVNSILSKKFNEYGSLFLAPVSDQATLLDWWKDDIFFIMAQRWKGLSLLSWVTKFMVK